ncbi:hypothetical protein ABDK56_07030 [Sphingomonas sp. ASV193]|uniref:hypothetical protein n=1 Tax=Sphingomonas sp. ASV193 TaxID=3144405 RepID=UPI0032E8EC65
MRQVAALSSAALFCVLFAGSGSAQWLPGTRTPGYDPAADYVTPGQDEPGYRRWVAADPIRATYVKSFNDYLVANGVGGVAPTWQLLRTASDWQRCGAQPYDIPPPDTWPNLVVALRYIGAYVVPAVGPVEPVSNYRNPALNACAKGAPTSTHMTGGAVDMVPLTPISREELMVRLCRLHVASGGWNSIGLGFYKGLRFHIDARKAREWGTAGAHGGWGCPAVLAEGALPFGTTPLPQMPPTPVVPLRLDEKPDPLAPTP